MPLPINIEDLLNKQRIESNRIEFKKSWNPAKVYRTICAFANDFDNIGGGYILVGVEEEHGIAKRPVLGIDQATIDRIQRDMIGYDNKMHPYYRPRTAVEEVDGRLVIAIWVPSGVERPYDVMDDVTKRDARPRWYVRQGTSTIEAKGEVLDELREMANRVPFDDRGNSQIELPDLSPVLIYDHLRKVKSRLLQNFHATPLDKILEQMDLYVGPPERRYLKNVAAMMFCENPAKFFPYTRVDIVMFPQGIVRNPNQMIEAPPITGSVPTMIQQALNYLRTVVVKEKIIKPRDRAESIRFFNYPYQALEEAVVNALYHRDYQQHEPVEIRIQPEAITILSYAGPDRSISDQALAKGEVLQARRYRNRRLGDFLKEIDLTEGRATGIPTIQDELRRNGSPEATFETDAHRSFFLITLPCHPDFLADTLQLNLTDGTINGANVLLNPENGTLNGTDVTVNGADGTVNGTDGTVNGADVTVNGALSARQAVILQCIRQDASITAARLAERLQVSSRTIRRELNALTAQGTITRVGSDKTGQWKLL